MRATDRLGGRFWRLWSASVVSNLGDGISIIAYPWLAATLTRDPVLIAGLAVATRLPWLLFALPAGVLADRMDRRQLMLVANLLRFGVTMMVALGVLTGTMRLPLLYLAALLLGVGEVAYDNAAQSILPAVVSPERLERANGTLWTAEVVVNRFVGPPLGGVLIGVVLAVPFLIDAGSFLASAGLLLLIAGTYRPRDTTGAGPPSAAARSIRAEIAEGFGWLWRHGFLRTLALLGCAQHLLFGMVAATGVLYAQEILGLDAAGYGLLSTATAFGAILGSQLAPALSRRIGSGPALQLLMIGVVPLLAITGLTSSALVVAAAYVPWAFLIMVWNVIAVSTRQAIIPTELFGRVNSVYRLLGDGLAPASYLAGGALVGVLTAVTGRELALRAPYLLGAVAFGVLAAVAAPRLTTARIDEAKAEADAARVPPAGPVGETGPV